MVWLGSALNLVLGSSWGRLALIWLHLSGKMTLAKRSSTWDHVNLGSCRLEENGQLRELPRPRARFAGGAARCDSLHHERELVFSRGFQPGEIGTTPAADGRGHPELVRGLLSGKSSGRRFSPAGEQRQARVQGSLHSVDE